MKKILFLFLFQFIFTNTFGQEPKKIIIEYSDFGDRNENIIPGAAVLTGNVRVSHDGVIMTCNKAYYFEKENYIKAFGNVQMVQGDTLYLNSKYAEYNGNIKEAFATGDVVMRSPESTLVTDTINFDRNKQEAFYNTFGTITNRDNTLKSKSGRYFVAEKKFRFLTAVTITNPKYVIKTNHLDYYTNSGHSYLFGPSTITSKNDFIYTEKGFYNTKKNTEGANTSCFCQCAPVRNSIKPTDKPTNVTVIESGSVCSLYFASVYATSTHINNTISINTTPQLLCITLSASILGVRDTDTLMLTLEFTNV